MAQVPVNWGMKNLDTGETFRPQFPIADDKGLQMSLGTSYAEQKRFGQSDPVLQVNSGNLEGFAFETAFYAKHENIDISRTVEQFLSLGRIDPNLGRPPICTFFYGNFISETVVVYPTDPTVHSTLINGNPRHVTIPFTLKKYVPFSQSQIDPSKPVKESFYLVASSAESTYEGIAATFYGDAMKGDRLRKRHSDMPLKPVVGAVVKVPSKFIILSEVVRPESHVFDEDDQDAMNLFRDISASRNTRSLKVIL